MVTPQKITGTGFYLEINQWGDTSFIGDRSTTVEALISGGIELPLQERDPFDDRFFFGDKSSMNIFQHLLIGNQSSELVRDYNYELTVETFRLLEGVSRSESINNRILAYGLMTTLASGLNGGNTPMTQCFESQGLDLGLFADLANRLNEAMTEDRSPLETSYIAEAWTSIIVMLSRRDPEMGLVHLNAYINKLQSIPGLNGEIINYQFLIWTNVYTNLRDLVFGYTPHIIPTMLDLLIQTIESDRLKGCVNEGILKYLTQANEALARSEVV
jgi:hypothetical protein